MFKHIKLLLVFVSLFLIVEEVFGQFTNSYYPFIRNFQKSEYKAGMQTWMIAQAPNELMYFANDYGILEFDGYNWQMYSLDGRTQYRSVLVTDHKRIYVGSNDNFGYFQLDSLNQMNFHSMLTLLPPDERNIQEVWKIHQVRDDIVFQSYNQLIVVKNDVATIYKAPSLFHFSFLINDQLYVVDEAKGILKFDHGTFKPLKGTKKLSGKEVSSIIPYGKNLLIATVDHGVFKYNGDALEEWNTSSSDFLLKNQVYCALRIDENHIAFGTIQKGVLICANDGTPALSIGEKQGLQNNTILCMKLDKNGNLWLGSDNGIDLVYINAALSQLNQNQGLSSGYTAALHNGFLYLGTNQGVFYKKWSKEDGFSLKNEAFELIENTKGQIWKLQVIDDVLFCGHNNGTYLIRGTNARKISDIAGAWTYLRSKKNPTKIIAGTYKGLIVFEKKSGQWAYSKKIKGFSESSRIMLFDEDESIWMSHGFKGVFHMKLNEAMDSVSAIDFYNSKQGFKTDFGINVVKIKDQIIFLTPDGAFQFDESGSNIIPSEYFSKFFLHTKVNQAIEDQLGNIWYFSEMSISVKKIQRDGSYQDVSLPFKPLQKKFIEGFQFVYSIDRDHTLLGYEDGFIHYNPEHKKDYERPLNASINQVRISGSDSILFDGHMFADHKIIPQLDYKDNKLHFEFAAINFEIPEEMDFSTFLEGYDKQWSNWDSRRYREFTNLNEGKYSFQIKARNVYGVVSEPVAYQFEINPPWSRTNTAYLLYLVLVFFILTIIIYLVRLRISHLRAQEIKIQQQKYKERENESQKAALISEKEIIRLRNDTLRGEIKLKDKELANATMQIIQKNEFLIGLKNFIAKQDSLNTGKENNVKGVFRKIDSELNNEKAWKVFETHFGHVHEEFLSKLKKRYPQISPAELRLCACLRMNISSKEIATLLNISIRGVEAGRYRLRKAMNLNRETNLTDFILSI